MKKITAVLLLSVMLFAAACGSQTPSENGSNTDSSEIESQVNNSYDFEDDLGEYDFGGETFNIFTRTQTVFFYPLDVSEISGDLLSDDVYERNRRIEERFNILFDEQYYSNAGDPRTYMLAGDDTYDIYQGRCTHMYTFASEGLINKVEDIKNIDLSKAYWDSKLYEDLAIAGNHYFAVGDFNITSYDFTHVLLFNKQMLEDYKLGDLYELVNEGKWTFDKFAEMGRAVVKDLNGDTIIGEGDQYGFTSLGKQVIPGFWIAADTLSISKDKNGELVYSAPKDTKYIEVFQKIFNITWDDNIWHRIPVTVNKEEEITLFCEGKSLFTDSSCFQISNIRDAATDFGIVPYPKYTEQQENYYSRIEGCELFAVPKINANLEMTGTILEAMACESRKTVIPTYYDIALKVKFTRDEKSAEMLDLAFANRVFDFGDTILCDEFRDGAIRSAMADDNRNVASILATAESIVNAKLKTLNEAFSGLSD